MMLPRLKCWSILRVAVSVILIFVVWLEISINNQAKMYSTEGDVYGSNDTSAAVLAMVPQTLHKFLTAKGKNSSSHGTNSSAILSDKMAANTMNISEIKRNVLRYNIQQSVINEEIYGPLQNNSVVIVVQVHTRITYLRHLIVSLAQAKDIHTVLLIFSHDYYDEGINELVQSIDFCKVMQIFYPHSMQTNPNTFPGEDPGDCPRDIKKDQAIKMKCINALHPDLYGHYREAKFAQTKHHWWWKANRVFDGLHVTKDHNGLVLFLEEDHYVAEDFLHVLHLMEESRDKHCPNCNILCLGTYLKTYNYYSAGDKKKHGKTKGVTYSQTWGYHLLPHLYGYYQKVEVCPWQSSRHNMGMAFRRHTWTELSACSSMFCNYDDYNWDWSLQRVSQDCLAPEHKLKALVSRGPRVFHIGECGVHHKKANCDSNSVISKVQRVLRGAKQYLFPAGLTLQVTMTQKKNKLKKGNGGWGDVRDHELCINITREAKTANQRRMQFLLENGIY